MGNINDYFSSLGNNVTGVVKWGEGRRKIKGEVANMALNVFMITTHTCSVIL